MRATLVSLIALSLAAPAAFAQMTPDPSAPAAPPATAPMTPPPATSYTTSPPPAPGLPTSPTPAPDVTPTAPAPVAAAAPPPSPPPAPTDPVAIALISTLESVCVPVVSGGSMDKLTKAAGYRKSGDNYVMHGKGFQLTVLAPGSNPGTCHVDIVSPVDPEAPAKPLVVALHNWAAVTRGYTLYRNDKNVSGSQELTTRSWELADGGKNQALVLTTFRKADGTPANGRETSEMLFSAAATPSS
jgi:hypothetical protein